MSPPKCTFKNVLTQNVNPPKLYSPNMQPTKARPGWLLVIVIIMLLMVKMFESEDDDDGDDCDDDDCDDDDCDDVVGGA